MTRSSQVKPGSHSKPPGANEESTVQENIRTLASTQYFDDWSGRGAWPIVIANRAVGDLRQKRKGDGHVFKMISKKIKELSQGFFSDDNQKRLVGFKTEVPIYEAKVSRDLRIVYQIDLDTDVVAKVDKQSAYGIKSLFMGYYSGSHPFNTYAVIRLYGIFTHSEMDKRLWALVSHYHATSRGKEYRRRCLFRETPRTLGINVTLPAQFPHEEDFEAVAEPQLVGAEGVGEVNEKDISAVRSIVASEKFILMSKSLVKSIVDDLDGGHVFQVSSKEKEVIYYDSACFVLGRSGTGKTTCIVFKMLGVEKAYEWAGDEKPRQVFITQSPELAQRVQEYYRALVQTDSGQFPLSKPMEFEEEQVLADLRDEAVESFGLPSRYSLLEDKHFPLFLTFDQLCGLLEEDYKADFGRMARLQASSRRFDPTFQIEIDGESQQDQAYINEELLPAVLTMDKIKEHKHASVTFEVFAVAYWPHFDQRLTKDLDPALVYSEFLGVIEGSEFTIASQSGVLSRDDYLNLSCGNSLLASQRDRIYSLYESYRKARGQLGGYDAAERTHALIIATQGGKRIPGPTSTRQVTNDLPMVGYIMTPLQAQDNLLIDTKLIRNLSNNPHGILMAGDTAQTISAGSSFRFEDLKAFSWRLEDQDQAVRAKKRKPIHPTLFHLSVNYRSHGGIVDCASALVELISELFPNSIDKLKKESGLIGGPRPTFFSGWESSSMPIDQFLRNQDNVKIDFGANQVILVRNDAARNALRGQVGDIGLILTLYESKGLEFNDVLLYNFFEDSVASSATWRIVLNALDSSNHRCLPQFEEVRHAIVCTELKNLYVGLTRARNHCWILDVSERAEPMKEFWSERELIVQCGPGDQIPQLSATSSKSEWEAQGRALFEKQLYPQAILCFDRAGLTLERNISAAYEARKQARLQQATKSSDHESQVAFRYAGDKFLECAKVSISKQQNSCYLRAADCFVQAEEWKLAAETFVLAREFDMAAKSFRNAGCFAEAVEMVQTHAKDVQENTAEEIRKVARLEFLRTAQYEQAEELFDDLDEQLDYMEDYGLESGRIQVLEQHQRHEEAAEAAAGAAFNKGDIIEGVRLLKSSGDGKLLRQAVERALGGLWVLFPFNHQGNPVNHAAADALIQYVSNDRGILTEEETHQIDVFGAIRASDQARIRSLGQSHGILASDSPYRSILSLLCFLHSSSSLVPSDEWSIQTFISTAKLTWKYLTQLSDLARTLDISKLSVQRLLGVEPAEHKVACAESSENGFRIYSSSPLFSLLEPAGSEGLVCNDILNLTSLTSTESHTRQLAMNALYSVLRKEVFNVHTAAASLSFQSLYLCLEFAIFGNCKRPATGPGCRRQHVNSFELPETNRQVSFNLRARALIMQIHLVDRFQAQTRPDEIERRKIRRAWIHRMYETLMPIFPPPGGLHCIDRALVPELDKGAYLISVWCQQALFELHPRYGTENRFLSDALVFLDLAFRVDGRGFSSYVGGLHSSRLVKPRGDLMTTNSGTWRHRPSHSILHDFIDFYRRKSDDVLWRVIRATQHVVSNGMFIEVNVLVHLLEFIGREIIVQHRAWNRGKYGVFDGLVVPQSWALDLVKRPPLSNQKGFGIQELTEYLGTLYKALEFLREYSLRSSLANNTGFSHQMQENARLNISRALTGPGEMYHLLCDRLARNRSWGDLEDIIIHCPLNRGMDQLVRLFLRRGPTFLQPPPNIFIRPVVYNVVPELGRLLSLTGSAQRLQPALNPQAESFKPLRADQLSSDQTGARDQEKDPQVEEGDTTGLMRSDHDLTGFEESAGSHPEPTHTLTANEIDSGRKILFAYRRYTLQRRIRHRSAVQAIWRCYSRYLNQRNAPRSPADERYLKLQREYAKDIKTPEDTRSFSKEFYRHKAILLGCMPHVVAYLRGLEHVNQLQKQANRKRLQIAHHRELEEIQARMDICSQFTIKLKKLMSVIMPGSKELQDLSALKRNVKELEKVRWEMSEGFGGGAIPTSLEQHRQWSVVVVLAPPV